MTTPDKAPATTPAPASAHGQATGLTVPELFAEVYAVAPAQERGHLIEELLRPLGVLSLFGIAGGIFASIRFRAGWQDLRVRLEDIEGIRRADVVALVDHAQQVSVETVDGLAQMVASSPAMAGSAAAVVLVTVLLQRARRRRGESAQGIEAPRAAG